MEKENSNRNRIAAVRFTAAEYAQLERRFKATACRQMSEYLRKSLLHKPVIVNYRNESLDEVMLELVCLRRDLNGLVNNFNQTVKRLHTLRQIQEFRDWIMQTEAQREELVGKVGSIQKFMDKTAVKWLQ